MLPHLVIDAGVDTAWVRDGSKSGRAKQPSPISIRDADAPEIGRRGLLKIYQEPRDAWSFDARIRPFAEKW